MDRKQKKSWGAFGILTGLVLSAMAMTACSDSDSPATGGGPGEQSAVTLKGAAQ